MIIICHPRWQVSNEGYVREWIRGMPMSTVALWAANHRPSTGKNKTYSSRQQDLCTNSDYVVLTIIMDISLACNKPVTNYKETHL